LIFISISEIVRSIGINGSVSEGAIAVVSMADTAFHVEIHGIELGVRDLDDPDTSRPNPIEIRYTQEFEVVIHKTVGQKPITQCTIPDGLWNIIVKFNTLKGSNDGLSEVLTKIRDLTAGPRKLYTALFDGGLCTYILKKEITQTKGSSDWYHSCEITLIEANGGD
jgi:hypothetical protein